MILAFHGAITQAVQKLKKQAKDKGEDPRDYAFLHRLRYHILGLAKVWFEERNMSLKKVLESKSGFDRYFKEF